MLKFFRNHRQNLLMGNKTGKYLKYAIGEIVLVVIGILIALQINNWNENRKAKIHETEMYKTLLKDLDINEEKLLGITTFLNRQQSVHNHVFKESKGTAIYDSTIDYHLLRTLPIFDLIIKDIYYEKYTIIKNENIKKELISYFKTEDYVRSAITDFTTFKMEHLRPAFSKYGIHDTQVLYDNYQLDYFELAKINYINYSMLKQFYGSVELDQLLFDLGIKTSWALQGLKLTKLQGDELKQSLENELNLNK